LDDDGDDDDNEIDLTWNRVNENCLLELALSNYNEE